MAHRASGLLLFRLILHCWELLGLDIGLEDWDAFGLSLVLLLVSRQTIGHSIVISIRMLDSSNEEISVSSVPARRLTIFLNSIQLFTRLTRSLDRCFCLRNDHTGHSERK